MKLKELIKNIEKLGGEVFNDDYSITVTLPNPATFTTEFTKEDGGECDFDEGGIIVTDVDDKEMTELLSLISDQESYKFISNDTVVIDK